MPTVVGENGVGVEGLLWTLTGANMNSTADQAMTKFRDFNTYSISRIVVTNASTSLTLAAGGVYNTASKTNAVVAAAQTYSALTSSTLGMNATIAALGLAVQSTANLFLSLTTGQGGAATADFRVYGTPLT